MPYHYRSKAQRADDADKIIKLLGKNEHLSGKEIGAAIWPNESAAGKKNLLRRTFRYIKFQLHVTIFTRMGVGYSLTAAPKHRHQPNKPRPPKALLILAEQEAPKAIWTKPEPRGFVYERPKTYYQASNFIPEVPRSRLMAGK